MKSRIILFLLLGLDALLLFSQTSELSISYYETAILYGEPSFLRYIINISLSLFGQNDFALRLPMILMHIMSGLLLYKISKAYVDTQRNRLWLIVVFLLLPGVISSAIIIDSAGLILFGLLLFIYIYQNFSKIFLYPLLAVYVLIDGGFVFLFLALSIQAIKQKKREFFLFNISAFFVSLYLYGIDAHGTPKGHFIDSIGVYATIFTPIIFVYLFYTLYRKYLNDDTDTIWYISSTALVISLLLSFRQRVHLEQFAPYLIVALPLMAKVFIHSYRVRLKMFRKKYRLVFIITLVFLLINSSLVFFNKYVYLVIDKPQRHFAYKMHVAKELAHELKSMGINCIKSDAKMQDRLKFYNVTKCNNYILFKNAINTDNKDSVTISYKNIPVYTATVTKLNIN